MVGAIDAPQANGSGYANRDAGRSSVWSALFLAALIAALYGLSDFLERFWLFSHADPNTVDVFHVIRGAGTTFLAAGFAVWLIFRRRLSPFPTSDEPSMPNEADNLRNYCAWFISLRWVALVGGVALSAVSHCVLKTLPLNIFLLILVCFAALAAFNVVLMRATPRTARPYKLLVIQAVFDLLLLTLLLQLSGGVENPLAAVTILHVIIASILLQKTHARRILALSCVLLILLAILQFTLPGLHVHMPLGLGEAAHAPVMALGVTLPLVFILVATAYILSMVREELNRTAEQSRQAYEQLIRQEKMVVLGEVAAGVAHEINNPLHGVQSALAMFKRDLRNPDQPAELIPMMEEGLDRIALITRRLLLHSRRETMPMRQTHVNEVLDESIKFIEYRTRQQGTALTQKLDSSIPSIAADPKSLSEAFINLLVNALDAIEKGKAIHVETRRCATSPSKVEVCISDTGCGISPENLDLIFHPFFTTKPVGKGSGLGLSISKKIVEDHRGSIRVTSQVGVGSCFIMTFPAFGTSSTHHDGHYMAREIAESTRRGQWS
ncbi:MAG: hypothetical protein HYY16_12440 [Planctomycetes bacterium]|nr:hypothetical protein [Planctomycetota bacterium]